MKQFRFLLRGLILCLPALALTASLSRAADSTGLKTTTPEELLQTLQAKANTKPLLLYVGPRMLYAQAHIPGSEFIGAGSSPEGLQSLRKRTASLPKKAAIVLYCGCCPWNHCPNVNPAYDLLHGMGFTNVKVLYLPNNFGADWAYKGYPVAKGE